jgi:hypothetical protein
VYRLFKWVFTGFGAIAIIGCAYYFAIQSVVRIIAFPGILKLFRRNLEFSYCQSMAREVLRSTIEFKSCLEMF